MKRIITRRDGIKDYEILFSDEFKDLINNGVIIAFDDAKTFSRRGAIQLHATYRAIMEAIENAVKDINSRSRVALLRHEPKYKPKKHISKLVSELILDEVSS